MLALYRCGRQAEALAAYRDARRTLVDEIGIEPGAALRELEHRILAQDPELDIAPPPPPPPARAAAPGGRPAAPVRRRRWLPVLAAGAVAAVTATLLLARGGGSGDA